MKANDETLEKQDQDEMDMPNESIEDLNVNEEPQANEAQDETSSDSDANPLVDQLRAQSEENLQRMLRVQADFDNFRRRTRLEKEDYLKYAASGIVEELLPVVDNLERALSSSEIGNDFEALAKGLNMIYRQFIEVLEQSGLKAIESIGQPFDPHYHQAVMKVESDEHDEGMIVEELQKGYVFKEKVLRPSMVKVTG